MSERNRVAPDLRERLTRILSGGLSNDPAEHATQVGQIAGVLSEAFGSQGFTVTLVGGSAIEVHAPGIYVSGDVDVVIEKALATTAERDEVFAQLGLERMRRHWRKRDLFIETVPGPVAGPTEELELSGTAFRVVRKEALLRDRIVGFKRWRHTAYGDQAIAMLLAFGDDLDMEWLGPELTREGARDALESLRHVAASGAHVTHESLMAVIDALHKRKRDQVIPRRGGPDGANQGREDKD